MSYRERAEEPGPKKLLAPDGGPIGGVITLEFLDQIGRTLQKELVSCKDFVLADYFDYITRTSTGAIIAAGLALGWPVDRLGQRYVMNREDMFDKAFLLRRYRYLYDSSRLAAMLQRGFGVSTTVGSGQIRALLMMVLPNATTDWQWLLRIPGAPGDPP